MNNMVPMAFPCSTGDKTNHNLPDNISVITNNNSVEAKNNLSRRKYYLKTRARIPPAMPATTSAHHPGKISNLPSARYRRGDPGKCDICSTRGGTGRRQHSVYHRHASSKEVRRVAGCKTDIDSFFCPTCRFMVGARHVPGKFHNMVDQNRLKIVLSSSTLHNLTAGQFAASYVHKLYIIYIKNVPLMSYVHKYHTPVGVMYISIIHQ